MKGYRPVLLPPPLLLLRYSSASSPDAWPSQTVVLLGLEMHKANDTIVLGFLPILCVSGLLPLRQLPLHLIKHGPCQHWWEKWVKRGTGTGPPLGQSIRAHVMGWCAALEYAAGGLSAPARPGSVKIRPNRNPSPSPSRQHWL